ncbi:DUF3099 domain-containing protein [Nocardioides zeae]|uniref:DUF3099 domain-containing protein n=1 Tax=Nocardioides imazamoxiresistens TaxID=3231893 RepID=A0ABU3PT64_9ACTN|nr:DUF3099 domain-containing protein [Nocardioides zeae]MDT9592420.1 DUF3099 domain-containing protein [Nocardioides zeae]
MPRRPFQRRAQDDGVVRITTARTAPGEELDGRQRRYIIAMTVRTLCFVGAFLVGPGWLRWVLVAGAVFLPWFAVVAANVTSQESDGFDLEEVDAQALPSPGERRGLGPSDGSTEGPAA